MRLKRACDAESPSLASGSSSSLLRQSIHFKFSLLGFFLVELTCFAKGYESDREKDEHKEDNEEHLRQEFIEMDS